MKKKVVVTIGDPAGCGPYISLKAIEEIKYKNVEIFLVGDEKILHKINIFKKVKKVVNFIDVKTPRIQKIKKGVASLIGGRASLRYLERALEIIKRENIKVLITAPLSKEAVSLVLPEFRGHTEYLADYFQVKDFAMMMVSPWIKVVLVTRHILLRDVGVSLKKETFLRNFRLVSSFLREKFKIKKPRLVVASVNPHAGIETFLEREEKIIREAIEETEEEVFGPYPADTLFIKENRKKYHCIICCYHDQAMIPFKLLSLWRGVNLTIGLPIIRTSPAHGVAYEVVRRNKIPFHFSMEEAIKLGLKLS